MIPYGNIDLGQHWLRLWLGAWRHQAITWTNIYFSFLGLCGIDMSVISVSTKASILYDEFEKYTATFPMGQSVILGLLYIVHGLNEGHIEPQGQSVNDIMHMMWPKMW